MVVIEDLHVKRMLSNDKLAQAISNVSLDMFRLQMEYKVKRYGTWLVITDYPSSELCSACDWKNETLTSKDREQTSLEFDAQP